MRSRIAMIESTRSFASRLLRWYDRHRRDLPWRIPRKSSEQSANGHAPAALDPYHVLVSETMLQQTQVATVIPYFERFLKRFPTFAALADAAERDVLREWQGLGYYSRARNLQRAAKQVIEQHGGELPRSVGQLLPLPGIGRYTAGAIASIAFGCRAPIVDGNVARVICRLDRIETDPRDRVTQQLLWQRAEEILPSKRCGDFNSALMELGATVCTPRNPKCLLCPVRENCAARAAGVQERIPPPRKTRQNPLLRRDVLCIERNGRWLIEQRPPTGRWAGMWQFVTVPSAQAFSGVLASKKRLGTVAHSLSHRRYEFRVFHATLREGRAVPGENARVWARANELDHYPLPRPQLLALELLRER
jgi:A/G-specific adenine glycosylase